MQKFQVGDRFGKLVIVELIPKGSANNAKAKCRCDCGGDTIVFRANLRRPNTRSCGCDHWLAIGRKKITHGQSRSPEYRSWMMMKNRCHNPDADQFKWYGGRGIVVCERWRTSFSNFIADMGPRPTPKHSIDRIDVNGNYEPGNCRWATAAEQHANRRPAHSVTPQAS